MLAAQNEIVTCLIFNYLNAEPCSVECYPNGSDKISHYTLCIGAAGMGWSPVATVSQDSVSLQNKIFHGKYSLPTAC